MNSSQTNGLVTDNFDMQTSRQQAILTCEIRQSLHVNKNELRCNQFSYSKRIPKFKVILINEKTSKLGFDIFEGILGYFWSFIALGSHLLHTSMKFLISTIQNINTFKQQQRCGPYLGAWPINLRLLYVHCSLKYAKK